MSAVAEKPHNHVFRNALRTEATQCHFANGDLEWYYMTFRITRGL